MGAEALSFKNMLSKSEKEKLQRFLSISNTVIHKTEYAAIYCNFGRIKYQMMSITY